VLTEISNCISRQHHCDNEYGAIVDKHKTATGLVLAECTPWFGMPWRRGR